MSALTTAPPAPRQAGLIHKFAARFGVEPEKMMATLKATAFRGDVSNEQMMALLIVADQYGLNPWVKELYAFPDKNNGIVPVIGVDGWARIVNEQPQFDGVEFLDGPASEKHNGAPEWIECVLYRKDRAHPTRIRERLVECYRNTPPWNTHPARMLRHKAFMQCGRIAFSLSGIYDEDEAQRIIEGEKMPTPPTVAPAIATINKRVTETIDQPRKDQRAPTVAELGDLVNKAQTTDEIDLALSLMPRDLDEATRQQLLDDGAARRGALGTKDLL